MSDFIFGVERRRVSARDVARRDRAYRAFQGPNGWYVAFEDAEGSHRQPPGGGDLGEEEARREAQRRNAGAYREGVR